MQSYPYYTFTQVHAGQMIKMLHGKKFKSLLECVETLSRWSVKHENIWKSNQFAVLEYTSQYESRIIGVYTNGDYAQVSNISDNKYF